ncbi:MAG: tetratricopeptide repeat protein, partial [Anaerolineae bacterium]
MRLGTNFVWDKDWPNAVKAYRAALQEFPTDVEALLGLATAYFELEQYESVVRALQRALKADPSNQDALLKMGQVLERLGKLTDAAKTYVYAGNILAKGGNLDAAIEHWERAIRADPDQMQARNNLAHAHARQGKMAQAVSELVALAAICQSRDDLQKAAQFLQNAARMAPDDRFVQAAAQALEAGRSIRQVQQDMAASIEAPPPSASLPSEGDEALLSFADMEELAGEADQNLPNSPREEAEQLALEELANVLFEDASGYQGLSASKSEIDKLIGQAIDWQTRGDTAQAIQTFEKITQTGFKRAAVYFMLATQYFKAGQYERAIQFYTQAKTEKPYLLGINYALGECYRSQQDANQALKHFVEALRIIDLKHARTEGTQELIRLYEELVNNYITAGDEKKTQAFVNSLANFLSTKNYEAKIIQARRRLGNGDGASVSAWVEFLEAPNSEVFRTVMADTAEYMRQNMLLTASEACYKAIQKAPAYLPLHLRLAEIYIKQEAIETSIKKYLSVAEV